MRAAGRNVRRRGSDRQLAITACTYTTSGNAGLPHGVLAAFETTHDVTPPTNNRVNTQRSELPGCSDQFIPQLKFSRCRVDMEYYRCSSIRKAAMQYSDRATKFGVLLLSAFCSNVPIVALDSRAAMVVSQRSFRRHLGCVRARSNNGGDKLVRLEFGV